MSGPPTRRASLALLLLAGCSTPDTPATDSGADTHLCSQGLQPMGPACVPRLDQCNNDEVPAPGGGCKRVGVVECPGGLMGPPDWKCKPIGPPASCRTGWAKVKGGWCEPILPQSPCPAGSMEVIGQAACQPIGLCSSGTWGQIKTTAGTIYVNQNHTGAGAGTRSQPHQTIGAALAGAGAGAHIAVAAGTYKENLVIAKKVTLEGVCPKLVTIVGQTSAPAVELLTGAGGSTLRGVAITGLDKGLKVSGVAATVERVAVVGCAKRGIQTDAGASLTIRDSLVANNTDMGVALFSATVTLERTAVRDTKGWTLGRGIQASIQTGSTQQPQLTLRDCLVAGNGETGISLFSAKASVVGTVVRQTRGRTADNLYGFGIEAVVQPGHSLPSQLTVQDSLVADNRNTGILLFSSKGTVERTVVRDTAGQRSDNSQGIGILSMVQDLKGLPSQLTVRDSLVERNRNTGIFSWSTKAAIDRTVVRDTRDQSSDSQYGSGIVVKVQPGTKHPSTLSLENSLVSSNQSTGVSLFGSSAKLASCAVRDTRIDGRKQYGDGVVAAEKSTLVLEDLLVGSNARAGILYRGSGGSIRGSLVRDNVFAIDLEEGADPAIAADNTMEGNQINNVSTGKGLKPTPVPPPPKISLDSPDSP